MLLSDNDNELRADATSVVRRLCEDVADDERLKYNAQDYRINSLPWSLYHDADRYDNSYQSQVRFNQSITQMVTRHISV